MRSILIISLALLGVSLCQADDGQYHPELYGGGQYQPTFDGRYLGQRNGKYGSIYNAYQPFYYKALNRDILAPFVKYGDSVDQASVSVPVTYRTPVVPTPVYQPTVYSTPKPIVYSSPKPFAATPKSAVYLKSVVDGAATILRDERTQDDNNYHYTYETNNGIAVEEQGSVAASANGVRGGTSVRGFYEYIGDDGLKYRVDYIADENGYRASGAHLPKAP